ncbi:putative S-layer protein [Candidatus Woesearchaeota archaeon]|nr:putative S-layer protein [Candidatus Woesearchaeota archaeon]
MKKQISTVFLTLLFLLVLSSVAYAQNITVKFNNVEVTQTLNVNLQSGEDSNVLTLTLTNPGNRTLTNIAASTTFTDLNDNDGDTLIITNPQPIASLAPSATQSISFNFDVESGYDKLTKNGQLNIQFTEGSNTTTKTLNLNLNVAPLACQPNARSNDLGLDIENPDDGDEFEPGQTISLDLEIENNGEDDIDARVEALLYNARKDKRVDRETKSKNINEDDKEKLEIDLQIDEDEDDDLEIYVKVFDDDDATELTCTIETLDIELDVPEHKIKINNPTLSPLSAACGERVSGSALLVNVGRNEEDAIFEATSTNLGISVPRQTFQLEDTGRDREAVVSFSFVVPDNAQSGDYPIYFRVRYDSGSTEIPVTLNVRECRTKQPTTPTQPPSGPTQPTNGGQINQPVTQPGPVTGGAVFTQQDIFDKFNAPGTKVPTTFWIVLDVLLGILVIGVLVYLFSRNR